ncbi:MAG: type II toxin-antitoxin system RelE/ParE family toxin [Sphingomonas sp.]
MRLEFSARAQRDLIAIGEWIREDNPKRAITFIDEIEWACRELIDFPNAFPVGVRRDGRVLRKRVHGDYLILYEVFADRVVIAAVIHGARDLDAALG